MGVVLDKQAKVETQPVLDQENKVILTCFPRLRISSKDFSECLQPRHISNPKIVLLFALLSVPVHMIKQTKMRGHNFEDVKPKKKNLTLYSIPLSFLENVWNNLWFFFLVLANLDVFLVCTFALICTISSCEHVLDADLYQPQLNSYCSSSCLKIFVSFEERHHYQSSSKSEGKVLLLKVMRGDW